MNNLSLALKISNFKFDHDFLTNLLELIPTTIHEEDEEFQMGPPHNKLRKKYEYNYWEYRIHIKNNSIWIPTIINQFVKEVILNKFEAIKRIYGECEIELYIGVHFLQESDDLTLDSFHFDLELIKLFASLNIEIDIDQHSSR